MNKRAAQTILAELRGGQVLNQLTDAIHAASIASHELHKPATVTLRITIKPEGTKGVSDAFAVLAEVDAKLPEPEPPANLFYFDEDEGLADRRKKQADLPLQIAGSDKTKGSAA